MSADLAALLKRQKFGRGDLRPFVEDGELKGLAFLAGEDEATDINETDLSAKFLISTPTVDRAKDVVPPKSLDFSNFEKNGIVLWNHGQNPVVPFPLGTSINPETKQLAVEVSDRGVFAKCWFGKGVAQSEDMFKLVHQGIVKAASIHMVAPIEAKVREGGKKGARPGYEIVKASIAEWSLVDIPCNQDACRKAADSGRLLNERLSDEVHEILKGMVANMPKPKMLGKGWTPVEDDEDLEKAADCSKPGKKPMDDEADEDDTTGKKKPKAKEKAMESDGQLKVALDNAAEPPGAAILAGLHAQAKGMLATIKAAGVENPAVNECLVDLAKTLDPFIASCEGGYASAYPDGIGLDSTEAPDAEAVVKGIIETLTAGGNRWLVKGALHRLKSVAGADNLRPGQREALAGVVELVQKAVQDGEAAIAKGGSNPAADEGDVAALRESVSQLAGAVKSLIDDQTKRQDAIADRLPFKAGR